jgi:hypothetical protein
VNANPRVRPPAGVCRNAPPSYRGVLFNHACSPDFDRARAGQPGVAAVSGSPRPRWTSQNRPYVDTSKPANGAEPEQEYLYPAEGRSGKQFFGKRSWRAYTGLTWAEGTAPQGCDRSADPAAGMARGGVSRSGSQAPFWQQSDKSQGFGDRVPM